MPETELFVSVLTIGEITRGAARLRHRNDHRQAALLETWLVTLLRRFAPRLVPVDVEVAQEWGRQHPRRPVPAIDGLLAATAIVRGWTLVTRTARDVELTGVRLLDPFTGPQPEQ